MQDKDIKFVDEQLKYVSGLTDMFRASIVEALKDGGVWQERFELIERHIKRQIEIGFFKHYTVSNILNLIQNIKDTHPLEKRPERKPRGLYEDTIDQMTMDYIKKLMAEIFDKVDKALEKE